LATKYKTPARDSWGFFIAPCYCFVVLGLGGNFLWRCVL